MALPAHTQPWWAVTRASGIAAVAASLGVASLGLLLVARRAGRPVRTYPKLHRRASWLVLALIGAHIGAALLDRRHVPPYALVAPFLSPTRRVAVGTGALATWMLLLVTFTAASRRARELSWRRVHYLAYPACGFAVVHSLLGSDRGLIGFPLGLCSGGLIVAALVATRRLAFRIGVQQREALAHAGASARPSRSTATAVQPPENASSGVGPPREPLPADILGADRALRDALERLGDAQRVLRDVSSHIAAGAKGPLCSSAWTMDADARARRGVVRENTGELHHRDLVVAPSAVAAVRELLLLRGVRVDDDVARRTAHYLTVSQPQGHLTQAELQVMASNGDRSSVTITAVEVIEAIEAWRAWLPRNGLTGTRV